MIVRPRATQRGPWGDLEHSLGSLRAKAPVPVGFAARVLRRIRGDQGRPGMAGQAPWPAVSTIELEALRHGDAGFLLLDVLAKRQFDDDHIGGAQSCPLDSPKFLAEVARVAGGKSRKVVVYGTGPTCRTASRAAHHLSRAGYTDVATYGGGLYEWRRRGLVAPAADEPGEPDVRVGTP